MNKILAICVLGLALAGGGCSTLQAVGGFAITQNQLDGAESTYDGTSLASMDKYAALVACKSGQSFTLQVPCHDKAILKQWRDADKSVATAFSNTQDMITSGNNSGAVAAWDTLQTALNVAKGIATSSGVSSL